MLHRNKLKSVFGGYMPEEPCSIYDSEMGWMSGYSVEDAQWAYNNDSMATGYCCASC